jgi:CRISPR system Cascade subunit CasD
VSLKPEADVLLLRLDAPLMSFGGVLVDERGVTEPFPTLAMLTGLLGNALGYDHRQAAELEHLQERLRYAARRDRPGSALVDFQTVDLGQDFLGEAWTTRGVTASRRGGSAGSGTHIRRRHYWADAVFTVALRLESAAEEPDLEQCAEALLAPERPLFLGRKPCIPAVPLCLGTVRARSLRAALLSAPLSPRAVEGPWAAWWPERSEPQPSAEAARLLPIYDRRDWKNQVHTGRRFVWAGQIKAAELETGSD